MTRRINLLAAAIALSVFFCTGAVVFGSNTYFVSPDGDDANTGLGQQQAWKSLDRVNRHAFEPGDSVLLQCGGVWHGQLTPQGSGELEQPITLSSYGEGRRPVIDIDDASGAGVQLVNQSHWVISNLEVTSGAPPQLRVGRQGIVAMAVGEENHIEHITVRNCYVHDIWGQMGGIWDIPETSTDYWGWISSGIYVGESNRQDVRKGTADHVLIENNRIERVDKCGIWVRECRTGAVVRGNHIENTGGDGIVMRGATGGRIEGNLVLRTCLRSGNLDLPKNRENWWPHTAAVWIISCSKTVIQFNEVRDTGRAAENGDGNAFDFDYYCDDCLIQYNYSRNNRGGFLLIMGETHNNIARYNISENDQTHLMQFQCDLSGNNQIHNNIFYVDYGTVDIDYHGVDDDPERRARRGAHLRNNIFFATGQGRFREVYSDGPVLTRQFDATPHPPVEDGGGFFGNLYFGHWLTGVPNDPRKVVADPMFTAPGTGGESTSPCGASDDVASWLTDRLQGYRLLDGSPCIDAGVEVPPGGKRDFFGNPLSDEKRDIGAFERTKQ